MASGRPPLGPRLAEGLEGSEGARRRLRVILETLSGELGVEEACRELGIGPAAFHKLRARTLAEALRSLEPRPMGRPREERSAQEMRIEALEKENWQLQFELQAARLREEIALSMPHLLKRKEAGGSEKKTTEGGRGKKKGRQRR